MKTKDSILFIVLLFQIHFAFSQKKADSLIYLLANDKEDTNKVNRLVNIAAEYENVEKLSLDSTYVMQALKLAKKIGFLRGYANAYNAMAGFYWERNVLDSAFNIYQRLVKIDSITGDMKLQTGVICNLGGIYHAMGKFSKSLEYSFKALKMAEQTRNKKILGNIYMNIAKVYGDEQDVPKALEYNLKAKRFSDSLGDKEGQAASVGNIAVMFEDLKEHDSALKYNFIALKIDSELGLHMGVAIGYINIAAVYINQKKYKEAIEYNEKALKICKEIGSTKGIIVVTGNMATIYCKIGDTTSALRSYLEVMDICEKNGSPSDISTNSINLGELYIGKRDYKNAEKYLLKADTAARSIGAYAILKVDAKALTILYIRSGKVSKIEDWFGKYIAASDSSMNQDKSREIGREEAKFQDDKELMLEQANANNSKALADADNKRQRIITLLVAFIALSIALVAILIFRSLKITKREKFLVERQKTLMELKALRAQMNPHFIFNALNSIHLFILSNDSESAELHLSNFSRLIRMVLENSKHENIPVATEIKMLELYIQLELVRFSKGFKYTIDTAESINIEETFIPPLIIQPYVENAIWHGLMPLEDRVGMLTVTIENYNGQLKCTIDDNGIGRKKSADIKRSASHESLGLSISKERLEIINMLYNTKIHTEIIDKFNKDFTPAGTKVELLMPLILQKEKHA